MGTTTVASATFDIWICPVPLSARLSSVHPVAGTFTFIMIFCPFRFIHAHPWGCHRLYGSAPGVALHDWILQRLELVLTNSTVVVNHDDGVSVVGRVNRFDVRLVRGTHRSTGFYGRFDTAQLLSRIVPLAQK